MPDATAEKPAEAKKEAADEARMTFGEHLEELRSRLFKSLAVLLVTIVVAMVFHKELAQAVAAPHFDAMSRLRIPTGEQKFIAGSYGAYIMQMMKVTFIVSLFVTSPWIGYQLWAFVSAGLYKDEKKYVTRFAPASFLLFVVGCAFGYFVLIPYCLFGLASTQPADVVSATYTFSDYLSLVMMLTIILGGVFQMPLVMVFFARIGLVQPSTYNKWRRAAILGNVIFAAVVTPADILTMIIVAIPMLLLYEIGVVASYIVVRPAKKAP